MCWILRILNLISLNGQTLLRNLQIYCWVLVKIYVPVDCSNDLNRFNSLCRQAVWSFALKNLKAFFLWGRTFYGIYSPPSDEHYCYQTFLHISIKLFFILKLNQVWCLGCIWASSIYSLFNKWCLSVYYSCSYFVHYREVGRNSLNSMKGNVSIYKWREEGGKKRECIRKMFSIMCKKW